MSGLAAAGRDSGGRELLCDVAAELGQGRQEQDRPEHEAGTVDNEKSAGPKTRRDMSKAGQLVGV